MKVLHILYQSLPQISGSSIRSRDVLISQKLNGLDVLAVTSPFQVSLGDNNEDVINNIRYIRTSKTKVDTISNDKKNIIVRIFRFLKIIDFTVQLAKVVKSEKPDILHAHAMFFCALPALLIGKYFNIPVVYEIRSLWMSSKSKKQSFIQKQTSKILLLIELKIIKKVDLIIFINQNLKKVFTDNSISRKNIVVVPNAINLALVQELKEKHPQRKDIKSDGKITFGYVGTFSYFEGLLFLIECFQYLYDKGVKHELIIYGTGAEANNIQRQISSRPDIDTIIYKGTISPEKIPIAFSDIDVIINPRLKSKLTDSVTPFKPLEAMAYEKLFIGSDVGGIKELVTDGVNGFLFKSGDLNSFISVIDKVTKLDVKTKKELILSSVKYIKEHRSWHKNSEIYKKEYNKLV